MVYVVLPEITLSVTVAWNCPSEIMFQGVDDFLYVGGLMSSVVSNANEKPRPLRFNLHRSNLLLLKILSTFLATPLHYPWLGGPQDPAAVGHLGGLAGGASRHGWSPVALLHLAFVPDDTPVPYQSVPSQRLALIPCSI